jgi:hypothetical protein
VQQVARDAAGIGSGGGERPGGPGVLERTRRRPELGVDGRARAHDAETQLALELAGQTGEDERATLSRAPARRLQQAALPDPGRALDDHEALRPAGGGVEGSGERREVRLALDECRPSACHQPELPRQAREASRALDPRNLDGLYRAG